MADNEWEELLSLVEQLRRTPSIEDFMALAILLETAGLTHADVGMNADEVEHLRKAALPISARQWLEVLRKDDLPPPPLSALLRAAPFAIRQGVQRGLATFEELGTSEEELTRIEERLENYE